MPLTDESLEHGHTGRILRRIVLLDEQALEGRADFHQGVEQFRIGQQGTENSFFEGRKPQIADHNGARFKEDLHRGRACRAAEVAAAAEKAAGEPLVNGLRVLNDKVGQVFHKGDFASGYVALFAGFVKNRAEGLAEAAFHAGDQLVVQSHQRIGKPGKIVHAPAPVPDEKCLPSVRLA